MSKRHRSRDPLVRASIFISFALRHGPADAGVTVDREGWCPVAELLGACRSRGHDIDAANLAQIVASDDKGRYALSADGRRIRALQGHSFPVDLGLEPLEPPEYLYHGTSTRTLAAIMADGLQSMGRQYLHLSSDPETAASVGARHGEPACLVVSAGAAHRDGVRFYRSENGVWLADAVHARYLRPDH